MAKKGKRKARNKIDKAKVDFFSPIDVLSLGGVNDPCFGKLHDISTPECQRCGDSELCAIKMMPQVVANRKKAEKGVVFKDQEETYIQVESYLKSFMKEGKPYGLEFLYGKIQTKFLMPSIEKAKSLLIKTYKYSGKFKKLNDKLVWKS
jgi:hypothetical protein